MWELDHKEGWVWKNWCVWTLVLEKTLEVSWTARGSNQSILKEISPEYSLEGWCRSSNTLAIWCEELTHLKRPRCWESLKAGEGDDRGWDGWWHHWLNAYEFEQAPGVGDGQGSLACYSPWGRKDLETTEQLNWTEDLVTTETMKESELEWVELNIDDLLLSTLWLNLCECISVFKAINAQGLCF